MKRLILLFMTVMAAAGCKSSPKLLPNVSGKAGEVIVVIEKEDWEGEMGGCIRELLACECPYLAQVEPLYTLANVAPGGFADLFKIHRNIVLVNKDPQLDSSSVIFQHDVWASPQCVIQLNAADAEGIRDLLKRKGEMVTSSIEQAERDRVIANSIRYEEKSIAETVREKFGGSPHFPMGYKLRKCTDDFAWIADEKQYTNQGILIYRYPVEDGDVFSPASIIGHRNGVMMQNVPGMRDGSYMTTSTFFPPQLEFKKYKGREFAQLRGYWEVVNDYMGGPFVSHSFYSQDGKYVITAEAFVYAAKFDKRQYLRQVESILYSWEWEKK